MLEEACAAPAAVAEMLAADVSDYFALGAQLRSQPPRSMLTIARGSSDHAAHYMAYLIMARLGRLVTSLPMSLITLYQSRLSCDDLVSFAFSQSGQSPDLVAPIHFFRAGGARTVAFVNDATSPLAHAAQWVFPLHAGAETSVAATKSYIAQLAAGARLVAAWQGDRELQDAVARLPEVLERAVRQDWSPAIDALVEADRLFVIGRGTGLAVAMEAALKFKETCRLHAEAVSAAELRHGPMALVGAGFPLLIFTQNDESRAGVAQLATELAARGADVLLAGAAAAGATILPTEGAHPAIEPLLFAQSFYRMANALSLARGHDPDRPPHLHKVTETL